MCRADQALGYPSWDRYLDDEFGSIPLRVPREDRPETVRALRAEQMSLRAIAATLSVSERTVRRDLGTAANAAVGDGGEPIATVIGLDGKVRPAERRPPEFKPVTIERDPSPPEFKPVTIQIDRSPPPEPQGWRVEPPSSQARDSEAKGDWTDNHSVAAQRARRSAHTFRDDCRKVQALASLDSRPDTRTLNDIKEAIDASKDATATLQRVLDRWPDEAPDKL